MNKASDFASWKIWGFFSFFANSEIFEVKLNLRSAKREKHIFQLAPALNIKVVMNNELNCTFPLNGSFVKKANTLLMLQYTSVHVLLY